jgi:hypothetical protein
MAQDHVLATQPLSAFLAGQVRFLPASEVLAPRVAA